MLAAALKTAKAAFDGSSNVALGRASPNIKYWKSNNTADINITIIMVL